MTRYILNSGGLKNEPDRARLFVAEAVSTLGRNVNVLLCFFAEPERDTWSSRFDTMSRLLQEWAPAGVDLNFALASSIDDFKTQVQQNDLIYLHGGITQHAIELFSKLNVPSMWRDKVVASNSATTHMLSESFWSADERKLGHGLGIVLVRTIAHFESHFGDGDPGGPIDWQKAYKDLTGYGDTSLPIHALKEGEFIAMERL